VGFFLSMAMLLGIVAALVYGFRRMGWLTWDDGAGTAAEDARRARAEARAGLRAAEGGGLAQTSHPRVDSLSEPAARPNGG
jgi:hypothetical protein